jgi:hypothetical protein
VLTFARAGPKASPLAPDHRKPFTINKIQKSCGSQTRGKSSRDLAALHHRPLVFNHLCPDMGLSAAACRADTATIANSVALRVAREPDYRPPNLRLTNGGLAEGYQIENVVPVDAPAGEAVVAGARRIIPLWSMRGSHCLLFLRHSASTAGGKESRCVRNVTAVQILSSEMSFPVASFPNCPSQANMPE